MNGDVDPLMALTERIDKALAAERIEFGPNALGILQCGGTVGLSGGERWSMALAAATVAVETLAAQQAAIAHQIRAELVCCRQYDETHDGLTQEQMEEAVDRLWASPGYHAICFWGEAAARLAEDSQ